MKPLRSRATKRQRTSAAKVSRAQKPAALLDVRAELRLNAYEIISRAVELGIAYGYSRAYKHTDEPEEEMFKEAIYMAVMHEIYEVMHQGE